MCTAITLQSAEGETFFGRTMDFSYPLAPELYYIPQGWEWRSPVGARRIRCRYGFMGVGQAVPLVTLTDGVNEAGLAAAALYFPGYAGYAPAPPAGSPQIGVAASELVNFLLGTCGSVEQAASALRSIRIVGVRDAVTESIAPLHWIIADKGGNCMVAEQTQSGLHLWENPVGVLTNSPDFPWHMTNLRNYMNVTPCQTAEARWGEVPLTPFSQGGGTFGLPGDFTPPSRFVRTAFQKTHAVVPAGREEAVVTCFHLMEGVTIPKGVVKTARGVDDYTQYTSFMNTATGEYFFKTYGGSGITAVPFPNSQEIQGTEPVSLGKMVRPPVFQTL